MCGTVEGPGCQEAQAGIWLVSMGCAQSQRYEAA